MKLLRGEGQTTHTPCIEVVPIDHSFWPSQWSGVPRGEDPPPLQAYEWLTGDRGVNLFSLTPLPLSHLNEGFPFRITYLLMLSTMLMGWVRNPLPKISRYLLSNFKFPSIVH